MRSPISRRPAPPRGARAMTVIVRCALDAHALFLGHRPDLGRLRGLRAAAASTGGGRRIDRRGLSRLVGRWVRRAGSAGLLAVEDRAPHSSAAALRRIGPGASAGAAPRRRLSTVAGAGGRAPARPVLGRGRRLRLRFGRGAAEQAQAPAAPPARGRRASGAGTGFASGSGAGSASGAGACFGCGLAPAALRARAPVAPPAGCRLRLGCRGWLRFRLRRRLGFRRRLGLRCRRGCWLALGSGAGCGFGRGRRLSGSGAAGPQAAVRAPVAPRARVRAPVAWGCRRAGSASAASCAFFSGSLRRLTLSGQHQLLPTNASMSVVAAGAAKGTRPTARMPSAGRSRSLPESVVGVSSDTLLSVGSHPWRNRWRRDWFRPRRHCRLPGDWRTLSWPYLIRRSRADA